MDEQTAVALNAINRDFYSQTAESFSETRQSAWPGWLRLIDHVPPGDPVRVLDVGCGNGRFGRFLAQKLPDRRWDYHGLDNSASLLSHAQADLRSLPNLTCSLRESDVILQPLPEATGHVVAAFGLLHHIPGCERRKRFVQMLAARTSAGGILALAAWRFYEYERFRSRIVPWPEPLQDKVEAGDYLLDWRRGAHALRYCHAIDDGEFSALIEASGLRLIARYRADGFSHAVNEYALLAQS